MPENQPINHELPTPETLAGLYVRVEGEEDLTIVPGRFPPQHLPLPDVTGDMAAGKDACVNVSLGDE